MNYVEGLNTGGHILPINWTILACQDAATHLPKNRREHSKTGRRHCAESQQNPGGQ